MSERFNFSLTTFSPSGELKQVDYANLCGSKGAPTVGICTTKGVILATLKRIESKLCIGSTIEKLERAGPYTALAYSGMSPDFRVISKLIQKMAIVHRLVNGVEMHADNVAKSTSNILQEFTQSCGVRPFGLTMLVGGCDSQMTRLYRLDAAGECTAYRACAIGQGAAERMAFLERHYHNGIEMDVAVCLAIQTIKMGESSPLPAEHLEIAIVEKNEFNRLDLDTVNSFLKNMK